MFDMNGLSDCNSARAVMETHEQMSRAARLSGAERQMMNEAQLNEAADLRKLLEQYEANQKEQAKENRVNRWLTVAALLIATVSMVAAILALIL